MFPRFEGVIGIVGFLILAYLLFSQASGATQIFGSLASGSTKLISTLQGR
jgi:hypothetical protein